MAEEVKQIIIIRTDLRNTKGEKIRTGKIIAQGAHASLGAILQLMETTTFLNETSHELRLELKTTNETALYKWLTDKFTKICVQVSSEKELLEIHEKAKTNGLNSCLIQDAGLTEFGGVATYTCCAVGPDASEKINEITGHLKLL